MDNQPNSATQLQMYESPRPSLQKAKFLTAASIVAVLFVLCMLTLTGTMMAVIIATPVLLLLSPVLVPAGMIIFLVTTGFFFSTGCGMSAILTLLWIYDYVTGKHPPGADKLDYAREKLAEKAKAYQQYVQQKSQAMQPQEA